MLDIKKFIGDFKALGIDCYTVEKQTFNLLPLSDDLAELVSSAATYNEALKLASAMGVYIGYRAYDDTSNHAALDAIWLQPELNHIEDPCIMYRVGERVVEITGNEELDAAVTDLRERSLIQGDDLDSDTLSTDLGQLTEDRTHSIGS